jgi:transcription elongation GreA/GreB family factor
VFDAIDKSELLELLRRRLAERLDRLTASQQSTQHGAVHPESRQEHSKDTRAIEATYLARGLAERVETLREALSLLAALELRDLGPADVVRLGALVALRDEDDRELVYLLAPAGGGEALSAAGVSVLVVTPKSPLGASLIGAGVDQEVEVELPGGKRSAVVQWLR